MFIQLFCVTILISIIFCAIMGLPLGIFRYLKPQRLPPNIANGYHTSQTEADLIDRLHSAYHQLTLARRKIDALEREVLEVDEDNNRLQALNRKLHRRFRRVKDVLQSYQTSVVDQLSNPITPNSSGDQITALLDNTHHLKGTKTSDVH